MTDEIRTRIEITVLYKRQEIYGQENDTGLLHCIIMNNHMRDNL